MSLKEESTKLKVIKLNEELGPVAIAKLLNLKQQTVSDFLNKETWQAWWADHDRTLLEPNYNRPPDQELIGTCLNKGWWETGHTQTVSPEYFRFIEQDNCWELGEIILVISDTHFPYHHPDTFDFLQHLAIKYGITGVVHVGDLNDNHYPSYHEKEYDCYSGKEELERSREACQELEKLFPNMLISEGNHDILPKRKAQSADIPLDWVAHPNSIYGLKGGWEWNSHHYFRVGDNKCLLVHSVGTNTRTNAERYSHCSVQGHHHSEFAVAYSSDTDKLKWAMSVGCLINPKAPAFRYDKKVITKRPILGSGVIVQGVPYLEPMVLKSNGRWRGY